MLFKYEDKYEIYKLILDKKIKLSHSIEDKSLSAEAYKKSLEETLPYIKKYKLMYLVKISSFLLRWSMMVWQTFMIITLKLG